jgi:hypothetical protein
MNPERVTARFVHTYYTLLVGKQVTEKGPKLDRLYNENATLSIAQTTLGAQRRVRGSAVNFRLYNPNFLCRKSQLRWKI